MQSWNKIYSNTGLPQEARNITNKQSNPISKELEKEEHTEPKVNRRKE